jgi:membrane-associated phospholipid phosphatase
MPLLRPIAAAAQARLAQAAAAARSALAQAAATDRAVMARVAATESPALDRVMPALSQAANHSVLWLGVAAALAATGRPRARRAALRGLASVVLASTASNVIGKGLTGRARPSAPVPPARRLAHGVRTTSFPSGHAASAAAFATGAALEFPALAAPVGALAAAVGASRVVTGVHFPSDVLAGFAVGAAAGALTLRCRPRHPARGAHGRGDV